MRWWERQVSGAAKGRIISSLRTERRTVDELALMLGVTNNAVRAQLALLEQAGIVRPCGTRQGDGAGKPATLYEIASSAEPMFSSAYAPVLGAVMAALGERLSTRELRALLRDVARRLAPRPPDERQSVDARVMAAAHALTSLGAELDVEKTDRGFVLRGRACPLATAVRAERATCQVVEELAASISGLRARERCQRDGAPKCLIELAVPVA